jgi:hypothetical protein
VADSSIVPGYYSQIACWMIAGGNRCRLYESGAMAGSYLTRQSTTSSNDILQRTTQTINRPGRDDIDLPAPVGSNTASFRGVPSWTIDY